MRDCWDLLAGEETEGGRGLSRRSCSLDRGRAGVTVRLECAGSDADGADGGLIAGEMPRELARVLGCDGISFLDGWLEQRKWEAGGVGIWSQTARDAVETRCGTTASITEEGKTWC